MGRLHGRVARRARRTVLQCRRHAAACRQGGGVGSVLSLAGHQVEVPRIQRQAGEAEKHQHHERSQREDLPALKGHA